MLHSGRTHTVYVRIITETIVTTPHGVFAYLGHSQTMQNLKSVYNTLFIAFVSFLWYVQVT